MMSAIIITFDCWVVYCVDADEIEACCAET